MDGFNGILDIINEEEVKMIFNRLVDILKIKDSKKIRQILLHWCYEMS